MHAHIRHYPMERTTGVTKPMLTRCQLPEVASCFRNNVIIQPEDKAPFFPVADSNIELCKVTR